MRDLPYLDACVNEAARLHPPFALPLERVVPEGGVTVSGVYLPGGTNVGGNPYVMNRHRPTFGEDVEEWRPERWLGLKPEEQKKLAQGMLTVRTRSQHGRLSIREYLINVMVQFGAGRRVCLGKHIAVLEIKKLVPFLVMSYDVSYCIRPLKKIVLTIFQDGNYPCRISYCGECMVLQAQGNTCPDQETHG